VAAPSRRLTDFGTAGLLRDRRQIALRKKPEQPFALDIGGSRSKFDPIGAGVDCQAIARGAITELQRFELGAVDYLTKPFHLSELNARVRALIRRKYANGTSTVEIGALRVDLLSRTAVAAGQPVSLSKIEYDLLTFLMTNNKRVVSKEAIAEHIYGGPSEQVPSADLVYSHIKNLKRKLKEKGCNDIIHTVYGLGYKLSL